ncbi:MAG: YbaB/EbfC family nucleoid-associated protein [Candidatus Pelagibacter sp. TMED166]|nr:MAG: YbaB/EbfC family nucleoid-associated protein [Candidatus Pelagibacter sp. TMED166]|tara:strand:- start:3331 stop:3648 length:318 start_codon:yes stop_codon:yes gene_type:complete
MFNGNMKKIMKQAKQMQDKMMETQKELESMEIEGSSGGGAVKVTINGKKELLSLDIDSELLNDDKEVLEDLIIVCINQAQNKVEEISKEKMGTISGGLPGGLPGF